MKHSKTLIVGFIAVIALVLSATSALALLPPAPYSGINTIGTVWQETYFSAASGYGYYGYYNYPAPARAGGFYGDTTAYLHGLRPGYYAPVAPVVYTNYYQPTCGYPTCVHGGAGFPRVSSKHVPVVLAPGI